jgi:hypothetical protein
VHSAEFSKCKSLPMEVLFLKAWEVTQFVHLRRRIHVVWDVLGTIRSFVFGGSQRVVCRMSTMTLNYNILMLQKLPKCCALADKACFYLFPEELHSTNTAGDTYTICVPLIAMMKTFTLTNVVPSIRKEMSEAVALVLGNKALLWLIFSPYVLNKRFKWSGKRLLPQLLWVLIATMLG